MRPCHECYGFVQSRYDEAKVLNGGFIVCVKFTSAPFLVVVPHGDKFDGNIFVRVAFHFAKKRLAAVLQSIFDVGYIKNFLPNCLICV